MVSATGHETAGAQGARILTLDASAPVGKQAPLAAGAQSALVATVSAAVGAAGDNTVAIYADIAEAENALVRLRDDEPDATVALSFGVDHGSPEARQAQIGRMLRSAASGTTIANSEAAMTLKARNPAMWLEPLGELPDVGGAISLYAIAIC